MSKVFEHALEMGLFPLKPVTPKTMPLLSAPIIVKDASTFASVRPTPAGAKAQLFDNQICQSQEWLTTEETAAYLRISVGALRNMTCNGQVPYHKLFGRNRYKIEDLRNLHLKRKSGGS